jgi:magnesium chelatase subunit I
MEKKDFIFPFTAIVGQEEMKLALILNIIDPKIGGVIIMGDRGTGKSTTIRALANLLPKIEVVKNNPYNQHPDDEISFLNKKENSTKNVDIDYIKVPMIDLPLGATEDRVCGTIDIEKALTSGIKAFEPGLLAKANRGILYVDEVNLLENHLIDILLDSAASGWNTVEREGISVRHPSRFVLVGSGNPEEGELRPQLLDRFGMHAEVKTVKDPNLRVKVVQERAAFDSNPQAWIKKYEETQENLKKKIVDAQNLLPMVQINSNLEIQIAKICSELNVDGLRGDIVINFAAKAFAAFENRTTVTVDDILKIITLCLRHRLRKDPLESIGSTTKIEKISKTILEKN